MVCWHGSIPRHFGPRLLKAAFRPHGLKRKEISYKTRSCQKGCPSLASSDPNTGFKEPQVGGQEQIKFFGSRKDTCLAPVLRVSCSCACARVRVCVECWYVLMMHWHRDPAMYVHTHGVLPPSPPSAMLRRHGLEVQLPQHQWCRHPPTRTESFIPTLAQHQPFAIAPTLNFRGAGITCLLAFRFARVSNCSP